MKLTSNTLILNEVHNVDGLIRNLLEAKIDEIVLCDGGSTDGTYEKLLEYEETYDHIKVIRWRQPRNSEYKFGWRESDRRNLMLDVSEGDYILSIDADERVSLNVKEALELHSKKGAKGLLAALYHFWGQEDIRVNTEDDRVWTPQTQCRVIKKDKSIRYKTNDANGLHNYLSRYGIKIRFGAYTTSKIKKLMSRITRFIIGFKIVYKAEIEIYHLHYKDLSRMKKNDLRTEDVKCGKNVYVENLNDGLKYNRAKNHEICLIKAERLKGLKKFDF